MQADFLVICIFVDKSVFDKVIYIRKVLSSASSSSGSMPLAVRDNADRHHFLTLQTV